MSDSHSRKDPAEIVRQLSEHAPAINEGLQQWSLMILDAFAPVVQAIERLNTPENIEKLRRFSVQLKSVQEVAQWWLDEAPGALEDALADGGTIPHPELALKDLATLLRLFREDGAVASVQALRGMHDELLADPVFRSELEARWKRSRRWAVLKQIFAAHDARLYGTAIPTALAQAEGLVVDAMGQTGRMGGCEAERVSRPTFSRPHVVRTDRGSLYHRVSASRVPTRWTDVETGAPFHSSRWESQLRHKGKLDRTARVVGLPHPIDC